MASARPLTLSSLKIAVMWAFTVLSATPSSRPISFVREAAVQQTQDVELALGERQWRAGAGADDAIAVRSVPQQHRRDIDLARQHQTDGGYQGVRTRRFWHIAHGAVLCNPRRMLGGVFGPGEQDHGKVGPRSAEFGQRGDAIQVGHGNIEKHDIDIALGPN